MQDLTAQPIVGGRLVDEATPGLVHEDAAGEAQREHRTAVGMDQAGRPPGLIHQVGTRADGDRSLVRQTGVTGCSHGARCRSRNTVFGSHLGILLESTRGQQYTSPRPDRPPLTVALDDPTGDAAVVDDQLDEAGVQIGGHGGVVGHRPEKAHRPTLAHR